MSARETNSKAVLPGSIAGRIVDRMESGEPASEMVFLRVPCRVSWLGVQLLGAAGRAEQKDLNH